MEPRARTGQTMDVSGTHRTTKRPAVESVKKVAGPLEAPTATPPNIMELLDLVGTNKSAAARPSLRRLIHPRHHPRRRHRPHLPRRRLRPHLPRRRHRLHRPRLQRPRRRPRNQLGLPQFTNLASRRLTLEGPTLPTPTWAASVAWTAQANLRPGQVAWQNATTRQLVSARLSQRLPLMWRRHRRAWRRTRCTTEAWAPHYPAPRSTCG